MDQKEPTFLKALCLMMCPHAEIQLRLKSNLGHKLEKRVINGARTEFADPQLMVKEFSRSSAGHIIKASDVRPVPVLVKTVKYLFDVVCSFEDVSWQEIYHFVSNRLRAVHQDVIVQGGSGEEVIHIFSSAARFYVYSHYRTGALKKFIKAVISYFCGNHLPLVRLASCLPPILAVALALQLNSVQRVVLGSWSVAYNSVNLSFKIEDLKELLLFSSENSLLRACHHYGISTSEAGVKFTKGSFNWTASLLSPEKAEWVEEKLNIYPIAQILLGTISLD